MEAEISEPTEGGDRTWVVRLHLFPNQRVAEAIIYGVTVADDVILHLAPMSQVDMVHCYFPFGGAGSHPAANAGYVAEVKLPSAAHAHIISLTIA